MPTTQQFFRVGLPVFAGFVALEFFILWRQGRGYSWKEGATSLAIGIGNKPSTTYKLDRMFGTYVEERADEPCRYGLVEPLHSHNPLWIAFNEWAAMAKDVLSAKSLREVPGYTFGPPGWNPKENVARIATAAPIDAAGRQAVRLT